MLDHDSLCDRVARALERLGFNVKREYPLEYEVKVKIFFKSKNSKIEIYNKSLRDDVERGVVYADIFASRGGKTYGIEVKTCEHLKAGSHEDFIQLAKYFSSGKCDYLCLATESCETVWTRIDLSACIKNKRPLLVKKDILKHVEDYTGKQYMVESFTVHLILYDPSTNLLNSPTLELV